MTTTFEIVPATSSGFWLLLVPIVLVLGLAATVIVASVTGARSATFEVTDDALILHGDLYGRRIPRDHLRAAEVRVVDVEHHPQLRPVRRTLGTSLPGYRAGWFRLADGQKALLYVTKGSRVVYVPTSEGYSVLLSPTDPDGLVARLRTVANDR